MDTLRSIRAFLSQLEHWIPTAIECFKVVPAVLQYLLLVDDALDFLHLDLSNIQQVEFVHQTLAAIRSVRRDLLALLGQVFIIDDLHVSLRVIDKLQISLNTHS